MSLTNLLGAIAAASYFHDWRWQPDREADPPSRRDFYPSATEREQWAPNGETFPILEVWTEPSPWQEGSERLCLALDYLPGIRTAYITLTLTDRRRRLLPALRKAPFAKLVQVTSSDGTFNFVDVRPVFLNQINAA